MQKITSKGNALNFTRKPQIIRQPVRTVGVNIEGRRIGQSHPKAKLTDNDVDLIRDLYEGGGWSYRTLADKFEVRKQTIHKIVTYEQRAQTVERFKEVPLTR